VAIGDPKFWMVCAWPLTARLTVCGAAAAKLPAAACDTVTEQLPVVRIVTIPAALTEQIAGVVEVYVGVMPEVVVAPIGVFAPTVAVAGTVGGMVMTSASGLTVRVSVSGVAGA
jgi:hypothetical protein